MKKIVLFFVVVILVMVFYTGIEKEPAYQYHITTWDGREAIGKLNRDQTYTFFRFYRVGEVVYIDQEIATFPAAEAAKLH